MYYNRLYYTRLYLYCTILCNATLCCVAPGCWDSEVRGRL